MPAGRVVVILVDLVNRIFLFEQEKGDARVVGRPQPRQEVVALLQVPLPRLRRAGRLRVPRLPHTLRGRAQTSQGLRVKQAPL